MRKQSNLYETATKKVSETIKKTYPLSFEDVLKEIFQTEGWYQGEYFNDGVFITVQDGVIQVFQFVEDGFETQNNGALRISLVVTKQKYRQVFTKPDAMRKV